MDQDPSPTIDECAQKFAHTLTATLHHYLRMLAAGAASGSTTSLECELRFHSWRAPLSPRPPTVSAVTWDRRLTYDEVCRVGQVLQSQGWFPDGPAKLLHRQRLLNNPNRRLDEHGRVVEKQSLTAMAYDNARRAPQDPFFVWFHAGFALSSETVIEVSAPPSDLDPQRRTLSRFSLLHDRYPWMRVDCSQWLETHQFELELELVNASAETQTVAHMVECLWQLYLSVVAALQQSFAPLLGAEWARLQYLWQVQLLPVLCFPQPVSIRMEHLQAIHRGEFALTQKIDGQREHLWFVDRALMRVETIGDHCAITHSGWTFGSAEFTLTTFVADAERTLFRGDATQPARYDLHIFDLLWENGTTASDNLADRLRTLQTWLREAIDAQPMPDHCRVCCKPYVFFPQDASLSLEARTHYFYRMLARFVDVEFPIEADTRSIDGYIFTATTMPLPAPNAAHRGVQCKRWAGAIKWKPMRLTTIDFQLGTFDRCVDAASAMAVADAAETPVTDAAPDTAATGCELFVWYGNKAHRFTPTIPEAAWLEFPPSCIIESDRVLWIEDGLELELRPHQIVECSWSPVTSRWRPLRVRGDKQVPNGLDVAHANWQLIQYPVPLPRSADEAMQYIHRHAQAYYDEGTAVADDAFGELRRFHNRVKQEALQYLATVMRGTAADAELFVIDFAFGRGGDILKYLRSQYTMVLGLDVNSANLHMAELRLRDLSAETPLSTVFHLLELNVGRPWLQERSGGPAQYLFSTDESVVIRSTLMANLLSCGKPMFHVGTMMFALHFLWSSAEVFDTWLVHIAETIRLDGYLVLTCFDGTRVHDYFRKTGEREFVFYNDRGERRIAIQPEFDLAAPYSASQPFGFPLNVYMHSVHQRLTHREFLVHPGVLRDRLAARGFREVSMPSIGGAQSFQELPWFREYHIPPSIASTLETWNRLFLFQRTALSVTNR